MTVARSAKIEVRLSLGEKQEISRRASAAGSKTASDWIRGLALADFVEEPAHMRGSNAGSLGSTTRNGAEGGEAGESRAPALGPTNLKEDPKVRAAFVDARMRVHQRMHNRALAKKMAEEDWNARNAR